VEIANFIRCTSSPAGRAVQYFKEIKEFYQSKERKKHKAIAKTLPPNCFGFPPELAA
jgi:hypothetical protein